MIEKIKSLLEQRDISQTQLAENIGVSQAFVCNMLKGYKQPSVALLKRISVFLNVPIGELID